MNEERRSWLELHLAVLLFGFTAILGKLIELPALSIVWWRVLLTTISLLFLMNAVKLFSEMPRRRILIFCGIGTIVALHWLTFYGSIKLANASIALVCMATASFFTSIIEPLFIGYRIRYYEIGLGIIIIPGMMLIANAAPPEHYAGIVVGLTSSALAATFSTLNKKHLGKNDPMQVTFLEIGSATLFLSIVIPVYVLGVEPIDLIPSWIDMLYLLVLALLCTTLAYVLALRSLRHLSAFATALSINLEPVYGIILAWIILKEHQELESTFYWGVALILVSVFSYPFIRQRTRRKVR